MKQNQNMKRLLLLMMMLYSGYSFCGGFCAGYATLNGKLIGYVGAYLPPGNMPVDSTYYLGGDDTIYLNNVDIQLHSMSVGEMAGITISFLGDTNSPDIGPYNFPKSGLYQIDFSTLFCDLYMNLNFVFVTVTDTLHLSIDSVNLSSQTVIKVLSNPITSTLTLTCLEAINQLNIYDQLGRLQLSKQPNLSSQYTYEVGVDGLSKGVYVVEATLQTNKKDYIKIVKQ